MSRPAIERATMITRRHFLSRCNSGLGAIALAQAGLSKAGASEFDSKTDRQREQNPLAARRPMMPASGVYVATISKRFRRQTESNSSSAVVPSGRPFGGHEDGCSTGTSSASKAWTV